MVESQTDKEEVKKEFPWDYSTKEIQAAAEKIEAASRIILKDERNKG